MRDGQNNPEQLKKTSIGGITISDFRGVVIKTV